jgi:hypothetical protein
LLSPGVVAETKDHLVDLEGGVEQEVFFKPLRLL